MDVAIPRRSVDSQTAFSVNSNRDLLHVCIHVVAHHTAYCGGVLDAQYNGTIYSPGYPNLGYQADVQCNWLIKVRYWLIHTSYTAVGINTTATIVEITRAT